MKGSKGVDSNVGQRAAGDDRSRRYVNERVEEGGCTL